MQNQATHYPQGIEKVAEKIKKLFFLSQSPNESEALGALEKAPRTELKY
jgi:hypothetical protein